MKKYGHLSKKLQENIQFSEMQKFLQQPYVPDVCTYGYPLYIFPKLYSGALFPVSFTFLPQVVVKLVGGGGTVTRPGATLL